MPRLRLGLMEGADKDLPGSATELKRPAGPVSGVAHQDDIRGIRYLNTASLRAGVAGLAPRLLASHIPISLLICCSRAKDSLGGSAATRIMFSLVICPATASGSSVIIPPPLHSM